MKKKILIEGMSCMHCVKHVKEALSELDGIIKLDVDLDSKIAVIEAEKEIENIQIKEAVEEFGYKVVNIEEI